MQFRYASSTPDNITQRNDGIPIYPTYAKISILLVQFMHQFSVSVILTENILYLIKLQHLTPMQINSVVIFSTTHAMITMSCLGLVKLSNDISTTLYVIIIV